MGIHGLWRLLDSFGEVTLPEEWKGKRVAIDASIWIAQFRSVAHVLSTDAESHILEGFLLRILKLFFYGIEPVFVFDGNAGEAKALERLRRVQRREKISERARQRKVQQLVVAQVLSGVMRFDPVKTDGGDAAVDTEAKREDEEVNEVKENSEREEEEDRDEKLSNSRKRSRSRNHGDASARRCKQRNSRSKKYFSTLLRQNLAGEKERRRLERYQRKARHNRKRAAANAEVFSAELTDRFLDTARVLVDDMKRGEAQVKTNLLAKTSTSLFLGPRHAVDPSRQSSTVLPTPAHESAVNGLGIHGESNHADARKGTRDTESTSDDVVYTPRSDFVDNSVWSVLTRGLSLQREPSPAVMDLMGATQTAEQQQPTGAATSVDVMTLSSSSSSFSGAASRSSSSSSVHVVEPSVDHPDEVEWSSVHDGKEDIDSSNEESNDSDDDEAPTSSSPSSSSHENASDAALESLDADESDSDLSEESDDSTESSSTSTSSSSSSWVPPALEDMLWNPSTQLTTPGSKLSGAAPQPRTSNAPLESSALPVLVDVEDIEGCSVPSRTHSLSEDDDEFEEVPRLSRQSDAQRTAVQIDVDGGDDSVTSTQVNDSVPKGSKGIDSEDVEVVVVVDQEEEEVMVEDGVSSMKDDKAASTRGKASVWFKDEGQGLPNGERKGAPIEPFFVRNEPRMEGRPSSSTNTQKIPLELLDVVDLLRCCGIEFIVSPKEADAQCAYLARNHLVDAVFTEDSDVVAHGATKVLRGFFSKTSQVVQYDVQYVTTCGITQQVLVGLALLLGCDYTNGVDGIGLVGALDVLTAAWEPPSPPQPAASVKRNKNDAAQLHHILQRWREMTEKSAAANWNENDDCSLTQWAMIQDQLTLWRTLSIPAGFPSRQVIDAFYEAQVEERHEPFASASPDWEALHRFALSRGLLSHITSKQLFELAKREFLARAAEKTRLEEERVANRLNGGRQMTITEFGVQHRTRERWVFKRQPAKHASALHRLREAQKRPFLSD